MPMRIARPSSSSLKHAVEKKPVKRLQKLPKKRDRTINYLIVEAILE